MSKELEKVALPASAMHRKHVLLRVRSGLLAAHDNLMECEDPAELAHGSEVLRLLAADMATMRREAAGKAGKIMKDRGDMRFELEGVGVVERSSSGGEWKEIDVTRAIGDIVRAIIVANEGEVPEVPELVAELVACLQVSGLKSNAREGTGLAKWGLERETYGTQAPRVPTIKVIGGSK